jgi:hypothetical protein
LYGPPETIPCETQYLQALLGNPPLQPKPHKDNIPQQDTKFSEENRNLLVFPFVAMHRRSVIDSVAAKALFNIYKLCHFQLSNAEKDLLPSKNHILLDLEFL